MTDVEQGELPMLIIQCAGVFDELYRSQQCVASILQLDGLALISVLDYAAARLQGLEDDLHLVGNQCEAEVMA